MTDPQDELVTKLRLCFAVSDDQEAAVVSEAADRIESLERELAKVKSRGARPTFDGEGKYESQWKAWDDGYCQGLGIEDERHDPEIDACRARASAAEHRLARIAECVAQCTDETVLTTLHDIRFLATGADPDGQ
jgi:hypothetical protein